MSSSWPKLPPGVQLGQVVGVAVNSRDEVHVFHRAGAGFDNESVIAEPTIAVFDAASGTLLRHFGAELFVVPHGLAIDRHDHIWVTDTGADAVFELDEAGRVLRRLGGAER